MKFAVGLMFGVAAIYCTSVWIFSGDFDSSESIMAESLAASIDVGGTAAVDADFTGSYADPNHPNCIRLIIPSEDSKHNKTVLVSGTDGDPGCPADGSGEEWQLIGTVQGSSILVDFTPKGGPKDLEGKYDDTSPAGIIWPDGNKWTVKT